VVDADALRDRRAVVTKAWEDAGRTDTPHFSASAWYALGPGGADQLRRYVFEYMRIFDETMARQIADTAVIHNADALRRAVAAAGDAGCDEFFLVPTTSDPAELDRTREALGI
jgi:hypothetical protein